MSYVLSKWQQKYIKLYATYRSFIFYSISHIVFVFIHCACVNKLFIFMMFSAKWFYDYDYFII